MTRGAVSYAGVASSVPEKHNHRHGLYPLFVLSGGIQSTVFGCVFFCYDKKWSLLQIIVTLAKNAASFLGSPNNRVLQDPEHSTQVCIETDRSGWS